MNRLLLTITLGLTVVAAMASPAAAVARPRRQVVLVLVHDSMWSRMPPDLESWASANLSLHSATSGRREMDSYLSIGKGGRSSGLGTAFGAGPVTFEGRGLRLEAWPDFRRHDRTLRYPGQIGSFGQALADHHVRSRLIVGTDFQAAAVLADRTGLVHEMAMGGSLQVAVALHQGVDLVVVETDYTAVPSILSATGSACVVVASSSSPAHSSHLGAIATAPSCGLGTAGLRSPTTRQVGFAVLADIAPTVVHLLGRPTLHVEGSALEPAAVHQSMARYVAEDRRARVTHRSERTFTALLVAGALVVLIATASERPYEDISLVVLAMPVSMLLIDVVPWWRLGVLGGAAAVLLLAGALAFGAKRAVRRAPTAAIVLLALTAMLIGLDAAGGGRLQLDSAIANNALGAGRFSGMGNVPYGFFAAACLLLAAVCLRRWGSRGVPLAGAVAVAAIVVDGAPMLGADVGGVLATTPAFAYLLAAWRRSLPLRRLLPLLAAGVLLLAAFAALDLSRPADAQTHLARALSGGGFASTLIRREVNALRSFRTNPYLGVVVVAVLGAWLHRARCADRPMAVGFGAVALAALLGTALNDSGVAVAGAFAAVAWPAFLLLTEQPDVAGMTEAALIRGRSLDDGRRRRRADQPGGARSEA